ncbi:MAG: glycoside hydrolase family 130 protein [Bacteroidales bacterium]|nr:glycoside hydrolase family 130 protein [Bacteroidales bacterium]
MSTLRKPLSPILSPGDLAPWYESMRVECLLNPGVFRLDGRIGLILRVAERPAQAEGELSFPYYSPEGEIKVRRISRQDPGLDLSDPRVINWRGDDYLTTISYLRLVFSEDGIHFHEDPAYPPLLPEGKYESFGIEDCRVALIGGRWYLTYTAVSPNGVTVGMRSTSDWKSFTNHGVILPPHNKDCALFEEKVGGKYLMLHRPSSPEIGGNYIWLAESPDLLHWGNHRCLARTREGSWDSARVGAGCSPIRTPEGWLMIYHGADRDNRYCLGAMLLDTDDPSIVLARGQEPLLSPQMPYEKEGFFGNVVFSNGQIVDGDRITMYYGASDQFICRAELSVNEILDSLKQGK